MKVVTKLVALAVVAVLGISDAVAEGNPADQHGSNATGTERVCMVSSSSEAAFQEGLKNCKRGDILDLSGVSAIGMAHFCDFTKTIAYTRNSTPAACVYIGTSRPATK